MFRLNSKNRAYQKGFNQGRVDCKGSVRVAHFARGLQLLLVLLECRLVLLLELVLRIHLLCLGVELLLKFPVLPGKRSRLAKCTAFPKYLREQPAG